MEKGAREVFVGSQNSLKYWNRSLDTEHSHFRNSKVVLLLRQRAGSWNSSLSNIDLLKEQLRYLPVHILANVFHYGQALFEGFKGTLNCRTRLTRFLKDHLRCHTCPNYFEAGLVYWKDICNHIWNLCWHHENLICSNWRRWPFRRFPYKEGGGWCLCGQAVPSLEMIGAKPVAGRKVWNHSGIIMISCGFRCETPVWENILTS